jgi:hypothetical protein
MANDYKYFIKQLQTWLKTTADQYIAGTSSSKTWCLLGLTGPLSAASFDAYFDASVANSDYQTEADNFAASGKPTNNPVAFLQTESDNLFGLAKMYTCRHQSRIKNYRDDAENKKVRTYSSLSIAVGKMSILQKTANRKPVNLTA